MACFGGPLLPVLPMRRRRFLRMLLPIPRRNHRKLLRFSPGITTATLSCPVAWNTCSRLPPGGPEWAEAIPDFAAAVIEIMGAKAAEIERVNGLATELAGLQDEFLSELESLEQDAASRPSDLIFETVAPRPNVGAVRETEGPVDWIPGCPPTRRSGRRSNLPTGTRTAFGTRAAHP